MSEGIDRTDELLEMIAEDERASRNGVILTRMCDITPERVSWLWDGYLPAGKLVTLDGDPGIGKSTLALEIAAVVSCEGRWPDGTACRHGGDVLILSAEDGLADTIRPRLDAAGADVTRVAAIEGKAIEDPDGNRVLRPLTLADIADLEHAIIDTEARLLIVDVLMAYLPTAVDSHKDQDIRSVLSRLAALADRTGCTVLLLRHLTKAVGRDPLYRGGGSIGIVGAARAGLLAALDPDDPDRRVLASIKSNLAATPPSLTYQLVASGHVARVAWGGVSGHSARDLLGDPEEMTARTEAVQWLGDYLMSEGGLAKSADAKRDGYKAGHSERTIKRAAKTLRLVIRSHGFPRETLWSLPDSGATGPIGRGPTGPTGPTERDQHEHEGSFGPTEPVGPVGPTSAPLAQLTFEAPAAEGRCPECGWHVETQGHHDDCPSKQGRGNL